MALTDPTSGAGYAFGQVLTSAHMTTIATQLPDAIDGAAGGTYTPTADIVIDDSSGGGLEFAAGDWPKVTSRTVQRWGQRMGNMSDFLTFNNNPFQDAANTDWHMNSAVSQSWIQNYFDGTGANIPYIILELETPPDGATITEIGAHFGDVGAGADAAVPPKLFAISMPILTGINTIEVVVNAPASYKGTEYNLPKTGLSIAHTEAAPVRFYAACYGEGGANGAVRECHVRGAYWKATVTELRY